MKQLIRDQKSQKVNVNSKQIQVKKAILLLIFLILLGVVNYGVGYYLGHKIQN